MNSVVHRLDQRMSCGFVDNCGKQNVSQSKGSHVSVNNLASKNGQGAPNQVTLMLM